MSYTYKNRKRTDESIPESTAGAARSSMELLRSGAVQPTQEQMGHRVDLPDVMREKMENAFGADLSAVKLYESQAVADAGANAIAQGSNIAFAPGMLDFNSFGGQSLLGHEISHVVSQARGEVNGRGFLNDHALESRADREGAMAAAGQQIAAPTSAMSGVSAAGAAGPMQASDKEDKYTKQAEMYRSQEVSAYDQYVMADDPDQKAALQQEYEKNRELKAGRLRKLGKTDEEIESDHLRTTDVMRQISRAHERNVVAPTLVERAEADKARKARDWNRDMSMSQKSAAEEAALGQALSEKAGHYSDYLGNLQKILGMMSDEELKNQPLVQKAMVDSYSAAHRAFSEAKRGGLGVSETQSSFIPGKGGDLLGTMYSRLLGGPDEISSILTQGTQDEAASGIEKRADESGVTELLRRQYERTTDRDVRFRDDEDVERKANTMRDFWTKAVMPAASKSPQAAATVSEMNDTMTGIPNQQALKRFHLDYIPKTGKPLTAEAGGDYLLHLSPNPWGAPRPGPMPDPKPELPPPVPRTLDLTPKEQKELDKRQREEQKEQEKMMREAEAQALKRFKKLKKQRKKGG